MTSPPFRAEHVGSLLRPPLLAEARARWKRGELPTAELQAIANAAIRDVVRRQEDIGLPVVTDGEFRRDWWHLDFLVQLDGVVSVVNEGPTFGGSEEQPPIAQVVGKVACSRPIMADASTFLRSVSTATPKTTIPSPSMLHLRGGRQCIARDVYPDLDEFWEDVALAYRRAIAYLAAAG